MAELIELFYVRDAWCAQGDDALAVGRPCGVTVVGGHARELLRRAGAIGTRLPDVAAFFGPGHIGEPLSIGRPRRLEFAILIVGDALGRA